MIVLLAVRLLLRWRRGVFHVHEHDHDAGPHVHVHSHAREAAHRHRHPETRTGLGAFGIGLVHGMGGSAGVGVLLVATIDSTWLSVVALAILAAFTMVSMVMLTTGFGLTLVSRPVQRAFNGVAPVVGVGSLAFGVWYATAAWALAPYPF